MSKAEGFLWRMRGVRDGFLGNYGGEKGIKKGQGKLKVMGRTIELSERTRVETMVKDVSLGNIVASQSNCIRTTRKILEIIQKMLETCLNIEILQKTMTQQRQNIIQFKIFKQCSLAMFCSNGIANFVASYVSNDLAILNVL
jgi:hypothetical protein